MEGLNHDIFLYFDIVKYSGEGGREEGKNQNQIQSSTTEILELPDQEFKITLIRVLRVLMEKMGNVQEQMGSLSREMETLRMHQQDISEIKNTNRNEECRSQAH